MFEFITYEVKVAVVLAVFYLSFKCLLGRENLHRLNRAVLLVTSVLSFVLPLCVITLHRTVPMPGEVAAVESGVIDIEDAISDAPISVGAGIPWELVVVVVYWLGVAAVLASVTAGIVRVLKLIRSGERRFMDGSEVVVCKDRNIPPFSWMHWIVLGLEDYESGNRHILEHEKAHIKLGHSKDVILVDVLSAFQWFNPAIWLLKRDLRAVHEYEADDAVLRGGANIKEYQYSLIRKAVSASGYSITNSFNHSILKNRITMMSKSDVPMMRGLRALYILPLACGALALNARTVIDYEVSENPSIGQTVPAALPSSIVKVEVKAEDGNVVYYVNGEKTALENVAEKVNSLGGAGEFSVTEIVVDGNLSSGAVIDLKEELRKLDALRLNVSEMTVTPKAGTDGKNGQDENPKIGNPQVQNVVPFQSEITKPTFNGGDVNEFSKWINANLQYPAEAKAAGIQGRVTLTFTVSETGKVKDVKVLKGVDPALDAEAVRVVSSSPDWTPGIGKDRGANKNKPVSVTYTVPVIFQTMSASASGTIGEVNIVIYGDKDGSGSAFKTDEAPVDFSRLTKKPGFNGGDATEFAKWVTERLVYPLEAKATGVQGRVTVKFKVNSDGKVSDVSVLRGICDSLDEAAVKLIASSPDWTPGEVDGKPVATTYTFPVTFSIR